MQSTAPLGKNSLPLQIRLLTSDEDAKFHSILDRVETHTSSILSTSPKAGTTLVCEICRLQDPNQGSDITLPLATSPCLLVRDGRNYISKSELDPHDIVRLSAELEGLVATLGPDRIKTSSNAMEGSATSPNHPADFVLYVPSSRYHVRLLLTEQRTPNGQVFNYFKDGVPLWSVWVATTHVTLALAAETLIAQFARMRANQNHGFTLLVRDFIKNAIALAKAIGFDDDSRKRKLFFPGIFDLAADVRQHYDTKMDRFISQEESEAGGIRKYNNLIKSVILSEFAPSNSTILDLACGHGQDLMKYRAKSPRLFVGTDIAQAALNEAKRRHSSGKLRYPAEFLQGNLMLPDIFLDVKRVAESFGITEVSPFDFMSIQLALHYIIGSKDAAKSFFDRVFRLLKPGGRFVATFPCCHRISRRLRNITPTDETFTEFSFGNSIYRVTFSAEELLKVAPTLGAVVDGKSMELFEAAIDELDFDELAQTVANTWGVQYKFWLVQTIDNQEEFIVPVTALEELISEFHASHETRGNFAETLRYYTDRNHSVVEDFLKRGIVLTDEEEEVFSFYRSIVITKE